MSFWLLYYKRVRDKNFVAFMLIIVEMMSIMMIIDYCVSVCQGRVQMMMMLMMMLLLSHTTTHATNTTAPYQVCGCHVTVYDSAHNRATTLA